MASKLMWAFIIVVAIGAIITLTLAFIQPEEATITPTTTTLRQADLTPTTTSTTSTTQTTLQEKDCLKRKIYASDGTFKEFCSDIQASDDVDDSIFVCSSINPNLKCPRNFYCDLDGSSKNGICKVNSSS
jgi:hypothetical protein